MKEKLCEIEGKVLLWLKQPFPPFTHHPIVIEAGSWIYDRRGADLEEPQTAYKNGKRVSIDLPPECLGREYNRYIDPVSGTVTLTVNRPENKVHWAGYDGGGVR